MVRFSKYFLPLITVLAWGFAVSAQTATPTPSPTPSFLTSGIYNQNHPLISIAGGAFSTQIDANYFQGDAAVLTDVHTISFSFYGTQFSILSQTSTTGPNIQVCIDSVCSNAGQYNSTSAYGISSTFGNLPLGLHTVTIKRVSTGGVQAFRFDAINVAFAFEQPTPIVTVGVVITLVPVATPEYRTVWEIVNPEGTPYPVAFEYSATAGDLLVGAGLYGLLALIAMILVVLLWKR